MSMSDFITIVVKQTIFVNFFKNQCFIKNLTLYEFIAFISTINYFILTAIAAVFTTINYTYFIFTFITIIMFNRYIKLFAFMEYQ